MKEDIEDYNGFIEPGDEIKKENKMKNDRREKFDVFTTDKNYRKKEDRSKFCYPGKTI